MIACVNVTKAITKNAAYTLLITVLLAPFSIASSETNTNQFYNALVAELYNQTDDPKSALKYYLPLALKSNDIALAKRVTELATGSSQLKTGLSVAKHWVKIAPEELDARQYLTLLLLRNGQLEKSSKQLPIIRKIVEHDSNEESNKKDVVSKGLKFIGALLVIESHHDKAYQVFTHYLKQLETDSKYKEQKNLILASLAMKAKKYDVVVSALDDIEKDEFQYFTSAAVMKTKALNKLGRLDEASKLIQRLIDTENTSDSMRLQLTRLLLGAGKSQQANLLLQSLVDKHPDNNDLLKALIALNINQLKFKEARINNSKLSKAKAYKNEVGYFFGEINEAEGNHKQALKYYQNVRKGTFLKNSHSKTAKLLVQLQGLEKAREWLQTEQKNSTKLKDKTYWLKLEADLLADKRLSATGLSSQDNLQAALSIYGKLMSLSPKNVSFHYHRGLLYERTNQIKSAETEFKYVIDKNKDIANALNALGFLLVKHTTRFKEAKAYIKQAYKIKPNDPKIMDSLGWVYFQSGDMKLAEKHLRNAYRSLKSPEVASHLIAVLSKSKKYQEAKQIFNTMIKKYPNNASLDGVRGNLEHI
jgi:tetratricopeptide (TPR) repeat protein